MKKFLILISALLAMTFTISGCSKEKLPGDNSVPNEQEQTVIIKDNTNGDNCEDNCENENPDNKCPKCLPFVPNGRFDGIIIGMLVLPKTPPAQDGEDEQKPTPSINKKDDSHRVSPRAPRIGKVKPQVNNR